MHAIKNGNSCAIIRTIESARAFSLLRTCGSMEISKLLPSSFVAIHVADHIYTHDTPCNTTFYRLPSVYATLVRCILSFTVRTCDARTYMKPAFYRSPSARTYHGRRILPFTFRAWVTLVHTITYRQCG